VIGVPFNDYECLAAITDMVAMLVDSHDPVLVELSQRFLNIPALVGHIRRLPQRDDDGDPSDGPRVRACTPTQRLRLPANNPNCVERAALYLAVAELVDPRPVRQLATLDTPIGLHTFPVENGAPVILDPRVPDGCLDCGLALGGVGPVQIDTHDAIRWTADLANTGAEQTRNGPSKVRRARNAVSRLVQQRTMPTRSDVDAIGVMFALAEEAAHRLGTRAVLMVQTTAKAIADITTDIAAQAQRNLAIDIVDGLKLDIPTSWMKRFGQVGQALERAAAVPLRAQLDALGIGPDVVALVEEELNREGLTLGPVAKPPAASPTLPTLANRRLPT
jgi:hypothetical protein